ncbi:alcohol dehydrogenase catalytic domain-containing protein [Chromohalobacter sp. 48-RD10]|uniref:zinc-dependent alcohol dehydrogenase n=1 Tax=Chromohalobacter sp. 48-RD10 TaxID=2994063 RepID=UPI00246946D1|nr:alcohol dehydrogenase catalytic domain-containing protein [Chromohalobacter sp. 48-RD10]
MKASLFSALEHLEFIDIEKPYLAADDDVIIEVQRVGICGSEVHAFKGTHPFRNPPSILGHEVVGRVIEAGSAVDHVVLGDHVVVEPHYGCGECARCMAGDYNLCMAKTILGTAAWPGAFAEYLRVPARTVYPVDTSLPLELAALIEPLAVGMHAARVAAIKPGDRVAVLGSGPIGLATAIAAHAAGAGEIVMTDATDRNLAIARELLPSEALDIRSAETADRLAELAGSCDEVFLSVGLGSVVEAAFQLVRRKGRVVSIALFEEPIAIDLNSVMIGEFTLRGSSMYVREDFQAAVDLVTSRRYPLEKLITHRFVFDDIDDAMELAAERTDQPIKVILEMTD